MTFEEFLVPLIALAIGGALALLSRRETRRLDARRARETPGE